jgi:hypothetical protein
MREAGFYWVRQIGSAEWEIAQWVTGLDEWWLTGTEIPKGDSDIDIGDKIKTPKKYEADWSKQ